jgi:hypothetical protein
LAVILASLAAFHAAAPSRAVLAVAAVAAGPIR